MNTNDLREIQRIFSAADKRLGRERVNLNRRCRYISAIWRTPYGLEIHGKAGTMTYDTHNLRYAQRHYNALARTYA